MQQLINVWQALDARRRVIVVGATFAVFAGVLALSSMASKPSMGLLYAGLEAPRAGDVITALDQRGITYEVRGDSIYVPGAERDHLRMTLAAEGLPANGGVGYELLDSLSGFGTTSQMFDAAYLRAKEGELARTIMASPHIRAARVHIATAAGQPFRRASQATASVTVSTASGGLSPSHTKALKFLVASAVAGMRPEDVSVIDGEGGLMMAGDESAAQTGGSDRATELKQNVERLLEARVGYGNAVVEVSVDTATEREAITERRFDPDSRVAISTDTEERTTSANDTRSGAVTVASNLPEGDGDGGGGGSQSENSETRERVNFEVSETTREILRTPGAVRRVTVAVLVDGVERVDDTGTVVSEPRPDEELEALQELVASAVGFDEARGDVITIKSMAFEPVIAATAAPQSSFLSSLSLDVMSLLQLAVLALVTLVLGLFVLRPILMTPASRGLPELAPPASDKAPDPNALTGEIDDGEFNMGDMSVVSDFDLGDNSDGLPIALGTGDFGGLGGDEGADPVARLRRLIDERQDESVEILRGWMEGQEEKA